MGSYMEEKGRSRKRQRQPEKWIVNECKKKRNSGKAYVSRHTKKEVPGMGRHVYHMSVISMPGALHTAEHKGAQT